MKMEKKYAIKGARATCQFGTGDCAVMPKKNMYVMTSDKPLLTDGDIEQDSLEGGFGICRSPFFSAEYNKARIDCGITNIQQAIAGMTPCQYTPAFTWQDVSENTYLSGYKGLLEDSWVMCWAGIGFISLIQNGQEDMDAAQQMSEKLAELEKAVDQYMKDNNIKAVYRGQLLDSILLWNGYNSIPWKYKSTERTRTFCEYMQESNPGLFNYFERGLYLPNKWGTGDIDITYLIGLNSAKKEGNLINSATKEMADNPAMKNAFLMVYGMPWEPNAADSLSKFLDNYENPEFDGGVDDSCREIMDYVKRNQDMHARYGESVNMGRPYLARGPVTGASDYDVLENCFEGKIGKESAEKFVDEIKSHEKGKGE